MASTMTGTKENFATLLALFTPIKGDRITLSSFLHEGEEGKEIDHAYVRAFINPAPDCDCAPLRTLWTAGRKIENKRTDTISPYAEKTAVCRAMDILTLNA